MADEQNGHGSPRLDRLEKLMELLIDDHVKFSDEHNRLLTAQVLLTEAQKRTDEKLAQLAQSQKELYAAQKHTDERMDALIAVVDDLIRRPRLE
jgi:hypothetical protein